jgi:hypothetical protein
LEESNMFTRPAAMIVACVLTAGFALSSGAASAANGAEWREHHPRRAEVNGRLAHQQARIHQEVREGDLTPAQGARLSAQDRSIRRQERSMASTQGGHITAGQQRQLNREENAVSREIPR